MKKLILFFSLILVSNTKIIGYCDIKGNVTNPGVYEIKENDTIKDIIDKSGGLKNNSYTDNINLSKKVTDEMVIYINTKDEINTLKRLNDCDCSPKYEYIECSDTLEEGIKEDTDNEILDITTTKPTTTINSITKSTTKTTTKTTTTKKTTTKTTTKVIENKIININTCTLEDLMTLKGLGEKKAKKVIEYRLEHGKFNSIEEIMNVSGIGESTFNAIKEFIEV